MKEEEVIKRNKKSKWLYVYAIYIIYNYMLYELLHLYNYSIYTI